MAKKSVSKKISKTPAKGKGKSASKKVFNQGAYDRALKSHFGLK